MAVEHLNLGRLLVSVLVMASVMLVPPPARAASGSDAQSAVGDASGAGRPTLQGALDAPSATSVTQGSGLWVNGWVADTASPTSPGVSQVQVYDGTPGQGQPLATATLGLSRPDVAQSLDDPGASSAGFAVDVSTGSLAPGGHTLTFVGQGTGGVTWQKELQVNVAA